MSPAYLQDRGLIRLSGDEARAWLHNLVTCDVAGLKPGEGRWGALLTPQGKIIVDFLVTEAPAEDGGGFLLDAPLVLVADLVKRLGMYRLRAKISIEDLSASAGVGAAFDGEIDGEDELSFPDPRVPELGRRIIGERAALSAWSEPDAYHARRIALGVPEGGKDFIYGDTFPHEANMDQLGAIDFSKGCYVGQEVVSRMQHRGSGGRTRILPVAYEGGFAASEGAEVKAADRIIGSTGSQANGIGLAKLRLDRVEEAMQAGTPILAGGIPIALVKPGWARFRFPGETESGGVSA